MPRLASLIIGGISIISTAAIYFLGKEQAAEMEETLVAALKRRVRAFVYRVTVCLGYIFFLPPGATGGTCSRARSEADAGS
jgi:hypothetical protein